MKLSKVKMQFFKKMKGLELEKIVESANNPELNAWISSVSGKSKGFAGEILEWLITDEKGDNKAEADYNGFEIKSVSYGEDGMKALEKMSLTAVSYTTIENETFETSHVLNKSKIFILKLTKNKNPLKRKFLGFGIIDLNLYIEQVKQEYNYYRDLISEGKANNFTSSAKVLGKNQILHVRTAGVKKVKNYINKKGIKYNAKPYNFTLDYKVIDKLIKNI